MDICLLSMPYPILDRPSLGLSLLVAAAKKAGLSVKGMYECYRFAEKIGFEDYSTIGRDIMNQVGEWTFSGAAFPEYKTEHEGYFGLLRSEACADLLSHSANSPEGTKRNVDSGFLYSVRRGAEEFIPEAAQRVLELEPRIVGCTSQFQQHAASLAILRHIKELRPEIITMMGGTSCDGAMGRVTKEAFPWVDFVVSGEADLLFPSFCKQILENGADVHADDLPFGVIGKENLTLLTEIEERKNPIVTVEDMNNAPIPDFSDFLEAVESFDQKNKLMPHLVFETSRGCWWHEKTGGCTFCSETPIRACFRSKSSERIIEELGVFNRRYGANAFMAVDDILDTDYFGTLFPRLASDETPSYLFFFEIKANMKEQQMVNLANGGGRWIQPGLESLHDDALKLMNKGVSALGNVRTLKLALENGVRTSWHILYGIPGENERWYDEMASWIPLIAHLQPPDGMIRIHLDRNSRFHMEPEKYDLSLVPHRTYSHAFPLDENQLFDFACFFEDEKTIRDGYSDPDSVKRLRKTIEKWQLGFPLDDPERDLPRLVFDEKEDETRILDTRPCAQGASFTLSGIAHHVHSVCRRPVRIGSLPKLLEQKKNINVDINEVSAAVDYLLERKLLLEMAGRLLCLATREPTRPVLTMMDVFHHLMSAEKKKIAQ